LASARGEWAGLKARPARTSNPNQNSSIDVLDAFDNVALAVNQPADGVRAVFRAVHAVFLAGR
jgi:hypothetical protein